MRKNLFTILTLLVTIFAVNSGQNVAAAVTEPMLTQLWKFTESLPSSQTHKDGAGIGGEFYLKSTDGSIDIWGETGNTGKTIATGIGGGIATDEAGNIIIRAEDFAGSNPTNFQIIPAGTTTPQALTLTLKAPGRVDHLACASGDVLSADGGKLYLFCTNQTSVNVITIKEGAQTECVTVKTSGSTGDATSEAYPVIGDDAAFLTHVRGTKAIYKNDGAGNDKQITTPDINSTAGSCMFQIQGINYIAYNTGDNYSDGFSIANMETGEKVATHANETNPAYAGNGTTANHISYEAKDKNTIYIYVFTPGNMIAKYEFEVPDNPEFVVYPESLYLIGEGIEGIEDWNTETGLELAKVADTKATFTAEDVVFTAATSEWKATGLLGSSEEIADYLYGAKVDAVLESGVAADIILGGSNFKTAAGKYDITIDLEAEKVTLVAVEDDPTPEPEIVEPTLTQLWKRTDVLSAGDGSFARDAIAMDGKFYIQHQNTGKIVIWDKDGDTGESITSGSGCGLTIDDAGNIVVQNQYYATGVPSTYKIIPNGKTAGIDLTLAPAASGKCFYLSPIVGDIMSDKGGVLYMWCAEQAKINKITIKNGEQTECTTFDAYDNTTPSDGINEAYGIGTKGEVITRSRGSNSIMKLNSDGTYSAAVNGVNYSTGSAVFTLGDTRYIVYGSGSDFKDGFTVGELDGYNKEVAVHTEEIVDASTPAYANFITCEVISRTKAYIYVYTPGLMMAQYSFEIPAEPEVDVYPESLYLIGEGIEGIEDWNTEAGLELAKVADTKATFTAEDVVFTAATSEWKATALLGSSEEEIADYLYGAKVDAVLESGVAADIILGGSNFKTAAGKYDITIDLEAEKVTLVAIEDDPTPGIIEPTLTQLWKRTDVLSAGDGSFARDAIAMDGKFYIQHQNAGKIVIWDKDGDTGESITSGSGCGLTIDDAGNIVVQNQYYAIGAPSTYKIIPNGKTAGIDLTLAPAASGQCFYLSPIVGDIMSDKGGVLYMWCKGQAKINKITIKNGVQTESTTFDAYDDTTPSDGINEAYGIGTKGEVITRSRGSNSIMKLNSDGTYSAAVNGVNYSTGSAVFTLGDTRYIVYGSGSDFKDGFTVGELDGYNKEVAVHTEEIVDASTPAYANFITCEVISRTKAYIYVYTPGLMMAQYSFEIPADKEYAKFEDSTSTSEDPIKSDIVVTGSVTIGDTYFADGYSLTIADGGEINAEGVDVTVDNLIIERTFEYNTEGGEYVANNTQWFTLGLPFAVSADMDAENVTYNQVQKMNANGDYVPAIAGEDYQTFSYNTINRAEKGLTPDNWTLITATGDKLGEIIQFYETGKHQYRFIADADAAKAALKTGREGTTNSSESPLDETHNGWNVNPAGKTYTAIYDAPTGVGIKQSFDGETGKFIASDFTKSEAPGNVFAIKLNTEDSKSAPAANDAATETVESYSFELISADGKLLDRIYLFDGSNKAKYRVGKMGAFKAKTAQMSIKVDGKNYCAYSSLAGDAKEYNVTLTNTEDAMLVMKSAGNKTASINGKIAILDSPIAIEDGEISIQIGSKTTSVADATAAIKVYAANGAIIIAGAESGTRYMVTNISGVTAASGVTAGNTAIEVAAGVYVVNVAGEYTKVIVK